MEKQQIEQFDGVESITKVIMNLDINCMETIFKFLPLNDLVSLSRTCSIFKKWAEEYFERKYENNTLQIHGTYSSVRFSPKPERYQVYFRSNIRYIKLFILDQLSVYDTVKFVNKNCSKNIFWLEICYLIEPIEIIGDHFQTIAENIQQLKVLKLTGVKLNFDVFTIDLFEDLEVLCLEGMHK